MMITIPEDIKKQLREWGGKGESYADIIGRLLINAKKQQIEFLMDETDCIPIEQAISEARKSLQPENI